MYTPVQQATVFFYLLTTNDLEWPWITLSRFQSYKDFMQMCLRWNSAIILNTETKIVEMKSPKDHQQWVFDTWHAVFVLTVYPPCTVLYLATVRRMEEREKPEYVAGRWPGIESRPLMTLPSAVGRSWKPQWSWSTSADIASFGPASTGGAAGKRFSASTQHDISFKKLTLTPQPHNMYRIRSGEIFFRLDTPCTLCLKVTASKKCPEWKWGSYFDLMTFAESRKSTNAVALK